MTEQLTLEQDNVTLQEFENPAAEFTAVASLISQRATGRFRVSSQPPAGWLRHALNQLKAIESLQDGWDSHGHGAPDLQIIRSAQDLLKVLATAAPQVAKPTISPTPSGGVQFVWELPAQYLEIELLSPTMARYFFEDENAGIETTKNLFTGRPMNEVISSLDSFGF